jgi:hypothetical protein
MIKNTRAFVVKISALLPIKTQKNKKIKNKMTQMSLMNAIINSLNVMRLAFANRGNVNNITIFTQHQ